MKPTPNRTKAGMRLAGICATFALALGYLALATPAAQSASSKGCEGGGFTTLGHSPDFTGSVAAPDGKFRVQGKYTRFDVSPSDLRCTGGSQVLPTSSTRPVGTSSRSTPARSPTTAGSA